MDEKDWKYFLLKSGLPFEYEVKECFAKHKCTVWDEFSYVKNDENNIEKEFSYDIDINYWNTKGDCSLDFMVECKYKTEPTKWFFLPDPYSYQDEVNRNSFLHPMDYFSENKFIYGHYPYYKVQEPLGPFCLKGVEVYKNQFLEVNIHKAINQLSYAFAEKLVSSIQSQIETELFFKTIFFSIPIIITNAELYLINEKVTTKEIENSPNIDKISNKYDFLFFHNKTTEGLLQYNQGKLASYINTVEKATLENRNKSFTKDISHFINVLSEHYCPSIILIMHHDEKHNNYKKLFDYINFIVNPSKVLNSEKKKVTDEWKKQRADFEKKYPNF